MTDLKLSHDPVLGFESKHIRGSKYFYKTRNVQKIAGYVPIVGTAVGIVKLVNEKRAISNIKGEKPANDAEDYEKKAYKSFRAMQKRKIARAAIETLSLGIIFLPIDLAVTVKRKIEQIWFNPADKKKT